MRLVTPVEVSLCTTITALMLCARSAASRASIVLGRRAPAPVAGKEIHLQPEFFGQRLPQRGEMAGFGHQHLVAGGQRVDDGGFPGPGARGRIDHHRVAGCRTPPCSLRGPPGRAARIPARDDRWWACPSRAERGPERWSAPGFAGNACRYEAARDCLWLVFAFRPTNSFVIDAYNASRKLLPTSSKSRKFDAMRKSGYAEDEPS